MNVYEQVIETLKKNQKTIFTAESCTAGMICSSLADVAGASDVLLGGVVAYSNEIKKSYLNVSDEILQAFGAVSFECAAAMAEGALAVSNADYVVAVSGIAGPGGGTEEKPVGTIYTAILSKYNGGWAQKFFIEGERNSVREQSAVLALQILLATELEQDFMDIRLVDAREL